MHEQRMCKKYARYWVLQASEFVDFMKIAVLQVDTTEYNEVLYSIVGEIDKI